MNNTPTQEISESGECRTLAVTLLEFQDGSFTLVNGTDYSYDDSLESSGKRLRHRQAMHITEREYRRLEAAIAQAGATQDTFAVTYITRLRILQHTRDITPQATPIDDTAWNMTQRDLDTLQEKISFLETLVRVQWMAIETYQILLRWILERVQGIMLGRSRHRSE